MDVHSSEVCMLTVAVRRSLLAASLVLLPAVAARAAAAQDVVILRPTTGSIAAIGAGALVQVAMPLSDDAIRSIVEKYEPGILSDDAEVNVMTIVVDNANNYVKSSTRAAKVLHAEPGQIVAIRSDSAGGAIVVRPTGEVTAPEASAIGSAVAITTFKRLEGSGDSFGVAGTGYERDEVAAISTKRFAPGTLAKGQLIVTVVRLK